MTCIEVLHYSSYSVLRTKIACRRKMKKVEGCTIFAGVRGAAYEVHTYCIANVGALRVLL